MTQTTCRSYLLGIAAMALIAMDMRATDPANFKPDASFQGAQKN